MNEISIVNIFPKQPPPLSGPCRVVNGPHRWAYLVVGGQACGYCGVPR